MTISFSGVPDPAITFSALAMDPLTGDIMIPITILKGQDAVIQKLRQRFRFFRGEWFLDKRLGVPYLQRVFVKNPDKVLVNSLFSKVILGTPGFKSLESFDSTLDTQTRILTVNSFQATLVDGTTVTAQAEPFIIL